MSKKPKRRIKWKKPSEIRKMKASSAYRNYLRGATQQPNGFRTAAVRGFNGRLERVYY